MRFLRHPGTWFVLLLIAVVGLLVSNRTTSSNGRPPASAGPLGSPAPSTIAYPGLIRAPGAGLRETADQHARTIYQLPADEQIEALSRQNEWLYVKTKTGASGWVRRAGILLLSGEPPDSSADRADPQSLPKYAGSRPPDTGSGITSTGCADGVDVAGKTENGCLQDGAAAASPKRK